MRELVWAEFNKRGELVTKRKQFKTGEAMQKFLDKLAEKDSFHDVISSR